ncbi:MAG: protein-glutamate O-methyltransferase CheR [Peptococcaceae bacterium]|jgi:chemotaxis protein methyltransferase CheR|nr:protein-glutamate O-methyltransferase CheR [Peptococcaceae bacterium]
MSYATIQTYEDFIKKFYPKSGLDLTYYKQAQMQRRIQSFMSSHGHTAYANFLQALDQDKDLFDAFFKHLTINVSQFFRDSSQWTILLNKVIPPLAADKTRLKFWSAGCSSGQEPYSLAMMMAENYPHIQPSILATDIDGNILKQAKEGIYRQNDFISTPPGLLKKYFTATENGYQIHAEIKRLVHFQQQNLLTAKFDSGFDFIACRNVVIYFTEEAKELLYKKFANALKPQGILFTGSTERFFGMDNFGLKAISSFFYQKS